MRDLRISRRLLFIAGSGAVGVTVLNTITGCSSSPSSSPGAVAPAPASGSATPPPGGTANGGWQRVNLSFVSAYILVRGNTAAIVDLGTPGSADAIGQGLAAAGSSFAAVRHVILTHKHDDHAGGLGSVEPLTPNAKIYTGAADVPEIVAAKELVPLKDGDEVFSLQVIHTPGHTPGHIAIFDPASGTLLPGDALRNANGLSGPDSQYSENMTQAAESVKKMATLDVKTILPGHGDPFTDNAAEALRKLAATG
ncbi:MBL fold metallo-hydrolase [Actinoplanes solisilvae]|uniref:MBL fold metallo-hydrolase n=1 Tax=Actinoplanes solisilvae TaxID=2486853 RepID=UPI000FDCD074|nr:MBL fold metallo-hydrolase [Actinoplanes solisilvae]